VGTAFSVLIRLELSGPGVQFIPDNQLNNSIITAHAIIMIFLMVIPILAIGLLLITLALASESKDNRATLGIKILATFLLTTIFIVYIVPAISKDIASFYHILYIQIAVLILYYFPLIINEIRSNYNTNYSLSLIIINDSISNLYVVLLYIGMAMIILDIFKTTKESLFVVFQVLLLFRIIPFYFSLV
jgi:heme/copper-type cytochrome/quinol oxidase subunit 1